MTNKSILNHSGVISRPVDIDDISHATGLSKEELKQHMGSDGKTVEIEFTDLSSVMQLPISKK